MRQLEDVLATFVDHEFAGAIALARRLAAVDGAAITRTDNSVPTSQLREIYAWRSRNPRLRQAVARQCARLAEIAGQFPEERWYIYIVGYEDGPDVTIFASEAGIGRVCMDYTPP